jgi:ribosomal protein S18 acetylase RimI-like enzyme
MGGPCRSAGELATLRPNMLAYRKATGQQLDSLLRLLRDEAGGYLEPTLRAMGATWDEFAEKMRTVRQVRAVVRGRTTVGFVWIEKRDRTLHVHGIALEPPFREKGIGTVVFHDLEKEFRNSADALELGVHESNPRARGLHERLGFRVEKDLPEIGFAVLRKPLGAPRP